MTTNNDPIGTGIVCPFRRDGKGDFANASGVEVLKSDIGELLGFLGPTATEPGELAWDTERGVNFQALKHRRLHSEMIRALADQLASGALRVFEPRVRPGITTVTSENDDTLRVMVSFRVLGFVRDQEQTVDRSV